MEAVGLASGVAGLVTLAITVTGAIHSYSNAIKTQPKFLRELNNELTTLTSALGDFQRLLSQDEAKSLDFDQHSVLTLAYKGCKRQIEEIGSVFLETNRNGTKVHRVWTKVMWPFQEKEIIKAMENLRRFTQVFHFALSIHNCTLLAKTSAHVSEKLTVLQDGMQYMSNASSDMRKAAEEQSTKIQSILELIPRLAEMNQTLQQAEERDLQERMARILDWLAPASSLYKHAEVSNRHAPGTGRWFLRNERFIDWSKGQGTSPDFLCVGGPGTGKTMLCAIVIDYLREIFQDGDSVIIYYYCDFAEQKIQTPSHFARCILRQMIKSSPTLPSAVSEFYKKTMNDLQDAMWLRRLLDVLKRVAVTFNQCFLVIDAIDETDPRHQRSGLMEVLNVMRRLSDVTRVFATTRPHDVDIEHHFPTSIPFEITASHEDLYEFLKNKIDNHPKSHQILDTDLRQKIISELSDNARGMFLLPALQIEHILDQVTKGDVKRALKDTARSLPEVFQSTMERIQNSAPAKRALAFKVLLWMSYARRPLTINELQHAVAVHLDEPDFDFDDVPSINMVLDSCYGLVELDVNVFDSNDRYIRFVHLSLYEFLQRENAGHFENADLAIARICLKYLTYDSIRAQAQGNRKALLDTLLEFPLLEYASLYWGQHVQQLAVDTYLTLASSLFDDRDALYMALRVRDARNPDDKNWQKATTSLLESGSGGIVLATSFGLARLVEALIVRNASPKLDVQNVYGSTPLHECAINGARETAEVLITHGAHILCRNKGGATPFYLAVSFDQIEMCEVLLKHGKDQLDIPRNDGSTALHKAADVGSDEMVQFLIQAGAKIDTSTNSEKGGRMTPLHLACRRGYVETVKLLVEAGANVQLRSKDGCTALDLAATGGFLDIVQYLIEKGVNVSDRYKGGWTALHRAASAGQAEIAQYLLDNGAKLLTADGVGNIPLTLAVKNGNRECIDVILNYKPDLILRQLRHKEKRGESTHIVAFYTAHYDLHKYLRELENELSRQNPTYYPILDPTLPITHAIEKGSLDKVKQLLADEPKLLLMPNGLAQTPLHTAILEDQREIAVEFLERGVPIDIRGFHGWTSLHIAAAQGSIRMLCLALSYRAEIETRSDTQQSPLHKAASSGSIAVVEELLLCGADPWARNNKGMTPLHVAAHQNFAAAARLLLDPRWQPSYSKDLIHAIPLVLVEDRRRSTARWWADKRGHLELAAYLHFEEKRAKSYLATFAKRAGPSQSSKQSSKSVSPNLSRSHSDIDSSITMTPPSLTKSMTISSSSSHSTSTSTADLTRSMSRDSYYAYHQHNHHHHHHRHNINRRSTSNPLVLLSPPPSIGGAKMSPKDAKDNMRRSTDSLFSALEDETDTYSDFGGSGVDGGDNNIEDWYSLHSPSRTPTFGSMGTSSTLTPSSSTSTNIGGLGSSTGHGHGHGHGLGLSLGLDVSGGNGSGNGRLLTPHSPSMRDISSLRYERRYREMVLEIDSD